METVIIIEKTTPSALFFFFNTKGFIVFHCKLWTDNFFFDWLFKNCFLLPSTRLTSHGMYLLPTDYLDRAHIKCNSRLTFATNNYSNMFDYSVVDNNKINKHSSNSLLAKFNRGLRLRIRFSTSGKPFNLNGCLVSR